jgi:hypothetical protein
MKNAEWKKFQSDFLDSLSARTGPVKLVDAIARATGKSNHAAYKKIRNDSMLGIDELIILARTYDLSIDQFLGHRSAPVPFMSDAIRKMPEEPGDYLLNLQKHLSQLTNATGLSYLTLAGEVPIFHMMPFHRLFALKLFAWNFTNWSIHRFEEKFEPDVYLKNKELTQNIEKLAHTYYQFPGVEIWNIRMLDIIIDQIKYFVHIGAFRNKIIVQEITSELFDLVDHLRKICTTGAKRFETKESLHKSNVKIYMNEIVYSNEISYVSSDQGEFAFIAADSPNYLRSSDPRMTAHLKKWLTRTMNHSTQISGEGEKERRVLFEKINQKLLKARSEIDSLSNYVFG